jgi:hypothetical protein
MIKYAPDEMFVFITTVLNNSIEKHEPIDIGRGILCALQKPGKDKGPVKNLRPVILLTIIRKILSNILLVRMREDYEEYLSPSQSAYRSERSTADMVWAHRWMVAKTQVKQIDMHICIYHRTGPERGIRYHQPRGTAGDLSRHHRRGRAEDGTPAVEQHIT